MKNKEELNEKIKSNFSKDNGKNSNQNLNIKLFFNFD